MTSKGKSERKVGAKDVVRAVGVALAVAAVVKELRKPSAERTWHGVVAGFVPYELRPPTISRFRERVWDPESDHLIGPRVFGVGWTLNLGRVYALARRAVSSD
ncbi:DUF5808 domain-containing protein [Cellulomonas palmilytica]|uniref:DUF5808 domain-containing protein n=1 Tax=Cellulomonas palmilytica TaxID=2608402 RepID=UPI001F4452EA|nr:DUF5808 domain-containing protein [Cellulomonas palmilytica]UJP41464.1 hypothetical protein F1D97_08655 [Cellulomonas palmilytica]